MHLSKSVIVSLVIGVFVVAGAFFVRAGDDKIEGDVQVSSAPDRTYIPVQDSNGNGISDWAESLIDDRQLVTETMTAATKPYELPTTLTGRFGIEFFQQYLYEKGLGNLDDKASKEELAKKLTDQLEREVKDRIYTREDIIVSTDDSVAAQRAYGNNVVSIVNSVKNRAKYDPIESMNQAFTTKNEAVLANIDPTLDAFNTYFKMMKTLPVPPSLVQEHLNILNVYNAVLNDLIAMRNSFSDPLLGMVRSSHYYDDMNGMLYAYHSLQIKLSNAGIVYKEDEPGIYLQYMSDLRNAVLDYQQLW